MDSQLFSADERVKRGTFRNAAVPQHGLSFEESANSVSEQTFSAEEACILRISAVPQLGLPGQLFSDEQGTFRVAAVPQNGLLFEENENSVLEQPLPLDYNAMQPLNFQPADTRTRRIHPGQNHIEALFRDSALRSIQGHWDGTPGLESHVPVTGPGFVFDKQGIDQLSKSKTFAESSTWEVDKPGASSASATGVLPFAEHGRFAISSASTISFDETNGFAQFFLEDLPFGSQRSTDSFGFLRKWSDGEPNPTNLPFVHHPAGGYWSGRSEATYADSPILGLTVPHQLSVSYHEGGIKENSLTGITTVPDKPNLLLPIHEPQEPPCSRPPQGSKGKKRKQDEIAGAIDEVGPKPPRQVRKAFADRAQREETARVRDMGACIRCALHKKRCPIDPADPLGICTRCQKLARTMDNLPCVRAKFVDAILYRNSVDPISRRPDFSIHFNTGIEKPVTEWNAVETRTIELTQSFDSILRLRVRKARTLNLANIEPSQCFIYQHPWALLDFQEAVDGLARFITDSIKRAVWSKVNKEDKLTYRIFQVAFGIAFGMAQQKGKSSELLQNVLKLWTAARCIEGGWRFQGPDTLDLSADKKGITHLTDAAIIDAQLSSIFVLHCLGGLREHVLVPMQKMFCDPKSRRKHWFELFLTSFILQHNFECVIQQQIKWARETNSPYRYTPKMWELVKSIILTSQNMLYYFHYGLKGQFPFDKDWKSDCSPKIAELSETELKIVRFIAGEIETKAPIWRELYKTAEYEQPGWFTGQLFLCNWLPLDTIKEAPSSP